jgi:hypothetical protein
MIIFQTSKRELRHWLERTEVRMNILRLCARRPYTLQELARIDLEGTPRLQVSHRGTLAEINVSVGIGECLRRELLVKVGEKPHPSLREGHMDLLRTTLLAFLLSPALARLEPEAYTAYVSSWLARPESRERFLLSVKWLPEAEASLLYRLQWELFLTLPEYLYWSFASFASRPELEQLDLGGATAAERQRIFGEYYVAGLITAGEASEPPRLGFPQLLRLGRARIGLNQSSFQRFLRENREGIARVLSRLPLRQRTKINLLLRAAAQPSAKLSDPLVVAPPEEEALQVGRLGPLFPL